MATTNFIPYSTVISSTWAQEVNDHVHNIPNGAGLNAGHHPYLNVQKSWTAGQAGHPFLLPSMSNVVIDMALGNNFVLPIDNSGGYGGSTTLEDPVNYLPGQSGSIMITSISGELYFSSFWVFPGMANGGSAPTVQSGQRYWHLMTYIIHTYDGVTKAMCNFASNYYDHSGGGGGYIP